MNKNKSNFPFFVLILITFVFLNNCGIPEPSYLEKMESSEPWVNPQDAPDDWLLAFIDVETTGLLPGYHEIIDIGIAMTDLDGNLLDTLFLRVKPRHPGRLSPGAKAVNAFDSQRWEELEALTIKRSADSIVSFHHRTAGSKSVLMVAYNSHFDAAFLDHLFRAAGRTWRELYYYYILDLPSMAWSLGFRDLTADDLMEIYAVADEPHIPELHTGITGAMLNVRLYRVLLKHAAKKRY